MHLTVTTSLPLGCTSGGLQGGGKDARQAVGALARAPPGSTRMPRAWKEGHHGWQQAAGAAASPSMLQCSGASMDTRTYGTATGARLTAAGWW